MDTKRLRQFCAIAETGSLTKAADLLHITHSGLSKSMKLLQDDLGCQLFRPSGRGLALTEIGMKVYERAKEFLKQEDRLFDFETDLPVSTLRIGTVEIFLYVIAEQLKFELFDNHVLTLIETEPGNIERLIANRELDYGITYAPFPMAEVEFIEIGKYRVGCYHLSNVFKGMPITEIPFAAPSMGPLSTNPLGIKQRDGWLESIHPRKVKYEVNLLSTAIDLVLQGLAAVYMPEFIARKINSTRDSQALLVEYPLPKVQKILCRAFLVKHKDQPDTPQFKKLMKMLKKAIESKLIVS